MYPNLLQIGKKSYKDIDIYHIGYIIIKKIGDYKNISSVNPLYLIIGKVDGHIECNSVESEKNKSKYFVFDSMEVLKKFCTLGWD